MEMGFRRKPYGLWCRLPPKTISTNMTTDVKCIQIWAVKDSYYVIIISQIFDFLRNTEIKENKWNEVVCVLNGNIKNIFSCSPVRKNQLARPSHACTTNVNNHGVPKEVLLIKAFTSYYEWLNSFKDTFY